MTFGNNAHVVCFNFRSFDGKARDLIAPFGKKPTKLIDSKHIAIAIICIMDACTCCMNAHKIVNQCNSKEELSLNSCVFSKPSKSNSLTQSQNLATAVAYDNFASKPVVPV